MCIMLNGLWILVHFLYLWKKFNQLSFFSHYDEPSILGQLENYTFH